MMYSAYKLNKQSDSIQSWRNPFPIWNQSVVCSMLRSNCPILTCIQISQEAGKMVWYAHLFKNFPECVVIHTVKAFSVVNEAEVDVFLESSCFFYHPTEVGNLSSGSSAFSKSSFYIWKFLVHVLLKPALENFQPYFTNVWDPCNCAVFWAFFGIAFIWGLHSICQQISKTQQWPQDWKRSVLIPIPKKGNAKGGLNYCTIALISHASKVMLKILQDWLQ